MYVASPTAIRWVHSYRNAAGELVKLRIDPGDRVDPAMFRPRELEDLVRHGIVLEVADDVPTPAAVPGASETPGASEVPDTESPGPGDIGGEDLGGDPADPPEHAEPTPGPEHAEPIPANRKGTGAVVKRRS